MSLPVRRNTQLTGWDPLREFENLTGRMNELLESTFGPLNTAPGALGWSPATDIEETDDAYLVEADLPGVKREDLSVELRESELVISGELKERERTGVLRRRSRRTGRFEYRVTLPGDADADKVEATLRDGVLTVRVPKTAKAQPRRIEITGS